MKILISSPSFFPYSFGGGEIYVYRLAKELVRRKYDITVMTSIKWKSEKGSYTFDSYKYEDIPVVAFSVNPAAISTAERSTGLGTRTVELLFKVLSKYSPDFVHINGMTPALTTICSELDIAHVVTAHHMGLVCPAGSLLRSDNSICDKPVNHRDCVPCCSYSRTPKWYTGGLLGRVPSWIYRPLGKGLNRIKNLPYLGRGLIYPWLIEQLIESEKILLERAELFIAPSLAMRELLIRNGCKEEKISLVPHGVEIIRTKPGEKINGHPLRFGYLGRIDPLKGLHILLEALERVPTKTLCELHIFGATRNQWDEEYYRTTLANYRGKQKLFIHGLTPHGKLADVFAHIDVLVVPSILPEAFGLVVQESFSAGRPVIVTNSGALLESVRNGVNGFVVERNDSQSLAEAMQRFVDNPGLIFEMSKQIPHVKTIQEYVDELLEIYRQVI